MADIKSAVQWMTEKGLSVKELVAGSTLPEPVVEAILQGRYTPSPHQRAQLATALGVQLDQIAWGHVVPVEHMYGEKQYNAEDPFGHRWDFTQTVKDVAPEEWGGVAVKLE